MEKGAGSLFGLQMVALSCRFALYFLGEKGACARSTRTEPRASAGFGRLCFWKDRDEIKMIGKIVNVGPMWKGKNTKWAN